MWCTEGSALSALAVAVDWREFGLPRGALPRTIENAMSTSSGDAMSRNGRWGNTVFIRLWDIRWKGEQLMVQQGGHASMKNRRRYFPTRSASELQQDFLGDGTFCGR
jgi:hypothetical protein